MQYHIHAGDMSGNHSLCIRKFTGENKHNKTYSGGFAAMNRTVYCTFDHRDLADIAVGKLRAAVPGIRAVSYVDGGEGDEYSGARYTNNFQGPVGYGGMFSPIPTAFANTAIRPARPVTIKIICNEGAQQKVASKLINLRAYRIVSV